MGPSSTSGRAGHESDRLALVRDGSTVLMQRMAVMVVAVWRRRLRRRWRRLLTEPRPAPSLRGIELGQHLTDDPRRLVRGKRISAMCLCDLGGEVLDCMDAADQNVA